MATKSFLKSVNIKEDRQIRILANALEKAEQYRAKDLRLGQPVYEVSPEKMHVLLSKYRNA